MNYSLSVCVSEFLYFCVLVTGGTLLLGVVVVAVVVPVVGRDVD